MIAIANCFVGLSRNPLKNYLMKSIKQHKKQTTKQTNKKKYNKQ